MTRASGKSVSPKGGTAGDGQTDDTASMDIALGLAERGGAFHRFPAAGRLWCSAALLGSLAGCDGSPSRNILGSYFPSWMVCALLGLALALAARAIFKALGVLHELPVPLIVMLAIGCSGTFAMWLIWLS
jgi:YtcA family